MSGVLCVTKSAFYHQILHGAEITVTMESPRLTFLLCSRLRSTTQYMTIYQGLSCQSPPSVPATLQRWITLPREKICCCSMAAGLFYRKIRPGLCLDNYCGFGADQPPSGHWSNLDTVIRETPSVSSDASLENYKYFNPTYVVLLCVCTEIRVSPNTCLGHITNNKLNKMCLI